MTEFKSRKLTLGICFAVVLLCLGGIWSRPLYAPDEVSFALAAREMLQSGDFRNSSPAHWATAGALKVFGETAFAVRFPSALFTLLTAGVIYLFSLKAENKKFAVVSAMLYLCSGLVFVSSGWGVPAPLYAFFTVSAAMAGFFYYDSSEKRWLYPVLSGLLAGAGFLFNGWIIPLTSGMIFVLYGLSKKAYRACFAGFFPVCAAAVLPILCGIFYFKLHFSCVPVLSGMNLLFALAGTFPVLLFLPAVIAVIRKKGKAFFYQNELRHFVLLSFLVTAILFVFAGNDSIALALPVFPFFALLLADGLLEAKKEGYLSAAEKTLRIFCVVLGIATVLFAVWHFLPAIPGKWKLFSQNYAIPPLMISGLLLLWYNMAAKEKACFPERKFLYFCIGTAVLSVSLTYLIPFKIQRKFDQTTFIRQAVLPRLLPGARIFADFDTYPAAAWVLRRKVELCFPETAVSGKVPAERLCSAVPTDKLKKIISSTLKKGGQVIIFTRSGRILSELPARRTTIRSGEMTAVIYGDYLK
ncbi:MAG: glycosyltransferase family 39 protein [Lentisphaeria bacterium]|nr:glycosyltransferase family 39 protein [Lentisphaeria bacterium]